MTLTRLTAAACAALWLTATVAAAADRQIVFVVRHAERADAGSPDAKMMSADPPLSAIGKARADRLAAILRAAQVGHIFTTELRRTRETAAPLAAATHLDIVALPAKDVDGLVTKLSAAQGASLVVGHSNTVPEILKKLGVQESVSVSDDDFDNLFVVIKAAGGEVTLVRLKY